MEKDQNITRLILNTKFILILIMMVIQQQLSAQYSSKIIEEWTVESKNSETDSPFLQITFFEDSSNAIWISSDSAVYSFYYIRKNKLYLSYLPESTECSKRKRNYYMLKFNRIDVSHIELFCHSKKRNPLVYTVKK